MDIYVSQKQFREALDALEIDISECARMLGYHPTSAYRWLMEGSNVPQVVGIAVGLMLAKKIKPDGLKAAVKSGYQAAKG